MKLIFVSGPYRADSFQGVCENIDMAKRAAIRLWQEGYAVFCPHLNTAHFDGLCHDDIWLDGDLEILSRCDAIYMMTNWQSSMGAKHELLNAIEWGKEIVYE